jgi:mono/diheme cytochrome c family protein
MRIHRTLGLFALGFAAAVLLASGSPRAQQHSYTQQDIDAGRALYDSNCGRCHNNDGAGVPGVELFKQIKRANSDDDIAKLIQAGIPGTSMPSHQFSTPQALTVVAYLRSMVGVTPSATPSVPPGSGSGLEGDAARGKIVFDGKGGCASCHAVNGAGGTTGPDLGPAPTARCRPRSRRRSRRRTGRRAANRRDTRALDSRTGCRRRSALTACSRP